MPADDPEFDRGVTLFERARERLGFHPTVDVDVLVVGGGVQGLLVLDELTDRGYAAALVSNSPLGAGQSLRSPGTLSKGYLDPDPAVREAVESRWLPFAERESVPVAGGEWYVLATDRHYERLAAGWDEHGYEYEDRGADAVPEPYREGTVFAKGSGEHVVAVDEYAVDREALVRSLADDHGDRVVVGDVTEFKFADGAGPDPALDRLTVETHQDLTVAFDPEYVVAATGTGTHGFVDSLVGADGFEAAGGDAGRVRESVAPVTYRNALVLAVRGPATDLPAVGAYLPHRGMSVSTRRHRHRDENYVTWYVRNESATEAVEPTEATDDATGTLDPEKVEVAYNKLFELAPLVKDRATGDADLEFYAYATLEQRVDGDSARYHATPLDGLANVGVALPSSAAGVWPVTDDAVEYVSGAVDPSGAVDAVATGGDPPIGSLADDRPGARWLDWQGLGVRYPRVQNRPDAVEKE